MCIRPPWELRILATLALAAIPTINVAFHCYVRRSFWMIAGSSITLGRIDATRRYRSFFSSRFPKKFEFAVSYNRRHV